MASGCAAADRGVRPLGPRPGGEATGAPGALVLQKSGPVRNESSAAGSSPSGGKEVFREKAARAGVEARRGLLEIQVSEEKLAPETDESLREVEAPPLPSLAEPRVPSSFLRDSNGTGADRNAQGVVLREVPGRIESDAEPTDGLNAEEDGGE
jgi:hypothetical protein